jgi:hypothetical protein
VNDTNSIRSFWFGPRQDFSIAAETAFDINSS